MGWEESKSQKSSLDLFDKHNADQACIDVIGIGASVFDFVEEGLKERGCGSKAIAVHSWCCRSER